MQSLQSKYASLRAAQQYCRDAGLPDPLKKFKENAASASVRGIEWRLTFDEWWTLWRPHFHLRGNKPGKLMLCREADQGCYEMGNVRIDTHNANVKEHGSIVRASAKARKSANSKGTHMPMALEHHGYLAHIFPLPLMFMDPMEILIIKQEFEATIREVYKEELKQMETEEIIARWQARTRQSV